MTQTPKDVMIKLEITLQRDGTLGMSTRYPNGEVAVPKIVAMGMLETAKIIVSRDIRDGEAP